MEETRDAREKEAPGRWVEGQLGMELGHIIWFQMYHVLQQVVEILEDIPQHLHERDSVMTTCLLCQFAEAHNADASRTRVVPRVRRSLQKTSRAYAEACYPRLGGVRNQRWQGLHPAGDGSDTSSSCRGALGATDSSSQLVWGQHVYDPTAMKTLGLSKSAAEDLQKGLHLPGFGFAFLLLFNFPQVWVKTSFRERISIQYLMKHGAQQKVQPLAQLSK
ncbi:hypothetical protein MC885_013866, partial [Smutsia gigantea]